MKNLLLILIVTFAILGTNSAYAQTPFCTDGKCTYTSLEPLPLPGGKTLDATTFPAYISGAFKLLLASGATIAVVMLVIGALTYMFSDVVGNKKKALDRIRGAMWAVLLLVCSYLILNTINPDLVTFRLDLGATTNPTNPPPSGATLTTDTSSQAANRIKTVGSTLTIGQATDNSASMQSQYDAFKSWCESKGGSVDAFVGGGTYGCK